MDRPGMRALLIFGVLYFAYGAIFLFQVEDGGAGLQGLQIAVTAAVWTLKAIAYTLVARGVLGLFLNLDRDIAFFVVLNRVTGPFLAVAAPVTPGFLVERLVPFYVAFLFFAAAFVLPPVVLILLGLALQ